MLARFLVYGCLGWVLESLFTGGCSLAEGDKSATSKTYLWMHPIYGATGLMLEALHERLRGLPRVARAAAYLGAIYGAELTSGAALRKALGRCPWDYEDRGVNVAGLVRLDYAPAWFLVGLAFEPVHAWLDRNPELFSAPRRKRRRGARTLQWVQARL